MTSRSPGRTDQELLTFSTCFADRKPVVWSNEPEAVDDSSVVDSITAAYSEVVHWKQNLFSIPFRQERGEAFLTELTRLLRAFDKHDLEGIALKAFYPHSSFNGLIQPSEVMTTSSACRAG